MKMFQKYLFVALAAVVGLTACSDEDDYVAGEQDAAGKAGVWFPSTNASTTELAPEEETAITIQLQRKDKSGEVTVPINVDSNGDDVFNVPSTATFADGDSLADVRITFPNAQVGTTYSLTLSVPAEYVSLYKSYEGTNHGYSFTTSVVRVKWNDLGTAQLYDGFWYGALFNDVKFQQRDDNKNVYRIANPYTDDFVSGMEETTSQYEEYFSFEVLADDGVSWDDYFPYNTYSVNNGGAILGWYPSALSESIADNDGKSKVHRDDSGNILYFELQPYWYILGVGGWGCYPLYISYPGVDLTTLPDFSD